LIKEFPTKGWKNTNWTIL